MKIGIQEDLGCSIELSACGEIFNNTKYNEIIENFQCGEHN